MSDGSPTLVGRLGDLAAATTTATLPDAVVRSVPQRVLDILGICVRATTLDTSAAAADLVAEDGGTEAATGVGLDRKVPARAAAFLNGVLAHSLDYDDTHLPSILHPSASVVPAALAAGESVGSSGAQVLAAVAVGLEVAVRTGMAGYDPTADGGRGQSVFFEHGQHATSICGALGSAAAAAALWSPGDAAAAADAIAVACSMASGIIEANRTGGTVKRAHCGFAAHAGLTAAALVRRGLTGAPTALEGRFGFFEAWLRNEWREGPVVDGLGADWCVADIFYKPYPANHFTHAGIDAARRLRAAGLSADDVAHAHLGVASPTVRTIGEPLEVKQRPPTGYAAQFSGPFTVAAALLGGSGLGLGLGDFSDERATDPAHVELMSRITVGADDRCDAVYPQQFPAVLTVHTHDGRKLEERVLVNRGGPGDPLTDAELVTKFTDNVDGLLDDAAARQVVDACGALATLDSLDPVLAPLRGIGPH
ncbi:MAG: MmgE/PrpD family protein [Actinomycetes bacterium]